MNKEGKRVIERYLDSVRAYLPSEIADDIISELRNYLFDTAKKKGNGDFTAKAAKETLAEFGAPSEVAEEYTQSMFPERDIKVKEPQIEAEGGKSVSKTKIFLKVLALSSLVFVIGILPMAVLLGPGVVPFIGILVLVQFLPTLLIVVLQILGSPKRFSLSLQNHTEEWLILKQLTVLPSAIDQSRNETLYKADAVLTAGFICYIAFLALLFPYSAVILMALVPLALLLGYRLKKLNDRHHGKEFDFRRMGQVDVVTLILTNIAFVMIFTNSLTGPNYLPNYFLSFRLTAYIVVYGIFILNRLATTGRGYMGLYDGT